MKQNISCTVLFFYYVGSRVHMGNLIFRFRILLHTSLPWSLHPAFLAMQCISHCLKLHSVITPFSRSLLFRHQCLPWIKTFFTAASLRGMERVSWLWWRPFFAIFKLHCFIYFTHRPQFPLSPLLMFPHLPSFFLPCPLFLHLHSEKGRLPLESIKHGTSSRGRPKLLHSTKVGPGIPEGEMGSKKVAWMPGTGPDLLLGASWINNAICRKNST